MFAQEGYSRILGAPVFGLLLVTLGAALGGVWLVLGLTVVGLVVSCSRERRWIRPTGPELPIPLANGMAAEMVGLESNTPKAARVAVGAQRFDG